MKAFWNRSAALAIVCALLCTLLLCACDTASTGEGETTAATNESTEATTTAAADEEQSEPEDTTPQKASYTVTVKTEAGAPVQGVRIQACKGELCLAPVMTDANGVATIKLDTTENITDYHVKINKFPAGYTGDVNQEYSFEADSTALVITIANPAA